MRDELTQLTMFAVESRSAPSTNYDSASVSDVPGYTRPDSKAVRLPAKDLPKSTFETRPTRCRLALSRVPRRRAREAQGRVIR